MGGGRRAVTAGAGFCLSGHRRTAAGFFSRCGAFGIGFFAVPSGGDDVFIIMGGSGCGKSSLMRVMTGLKEPAKGKVFVLGKNFYAQYDDLLFEFLFFLSAPVRHVRSCQITAKVCSSF